VEGRDARPYEIFAKAALTKVFKVLMKFDGRGARCAPSIRNNLERGHATMPMLTQRRHT
jgi:hypothetical protein